MAAQENKELKVREKQELSHPAEQTRPGFYFTPSVDIFETDTELTLLADMPGVDADNLSIDLRDDTLTLEGEVTLKDDSQAEAIYQEYSTGRYYRQFSLSEVIDQSNIDAQLKDGVLRLSLPKVAKATPRKIAVKAG
ncbi:MAG: Hsp20/alpha crystallin family protein [Desulfobacterales bacterium]|jgi:HSP20 family molecular chaperone IbpA